MVGCVVSGCFLSVMDGMGGMAMRDMRVMAGGFVVPCFVMVGRFLMVASGMFVVLRGFAVVLNGVRGHR